LRGFSGLLRPPRTTAFLLAAGLLAPACAPTPGAGERKSPLVVITIDGLRADAVGALGGRPGWTPRLDELASGADWTGRAVAASGAPATAAASLLTGLSPWQHQALPGSRPRLRPHFYTFAEACAERGYATRVFRSGDWQRRRLGFLQGFDTDEEATDQAKARAALRSLPRGAELVWLHLTVPAGELEVKGAARAAGWTSYGAAVGAADRVLGDWLDALRQGGRFDDALIAVAGIAGFELGEDGRVGQGGSLERSLIEVPLVVKLPAGERRRIAVGRDERVAAQRLFATLVEATGARVAPAAGPSLFRAAPAGALSELYLVRGVNRFSLVQGDAQLERAVSFAAPPPGQRRALPSRRLIRRFFATPPWTGDGAAPRLRLLRWTARGTEALPDPARQAALHAALERRFFAFLERETTADEESARRR